MQEKDVSYDKFINAVTEAGYDYFDIKKNWWYAGSDECDRDREIFKVHFPDGEFPEKEKKCICGVKIDHNHWITNGENYIVIGSVCQTNWFKFDTSRVCSGCKKSHKGRKDNYCTTCRKKNDGWTECIKCGNLNNYSLVCKPCKKYTCHLEYCKKIKGAEFYKYCYEHRNHERIHTHNLI
jgi:hypothetical protein